ncbi:MAG: Crp/Fnr family transcriptional regulator [Oceanicaulis sp.]|uniref:Crp/Fnr family transcriptional regulator n=1 Tax=Glycocaulis sp. TaxID=1969725 RepID=UPI0025C1859B|nr:Crp/Fnr family transcriptional regulator [Glycocaulis sp.]MCC5980672.1 Crp/Fnr family transcriptional regulator [Oceanicaulis sp.]MCH8521899.1 Crp/Fnr family transcriptional regulator [Glycocaulis sp.]
MNRSILILAEDSRCVGCEVRERGVCATLNVGQIGDMEAAVSVKRLNSGQILMLEGDSNDHVANVTVGRLKVYKSLPDGRTQLLRVLRPGDFLGAAFRDRTACTVAAITECELCILPRKALESLFERHREIEHAVMRQLEGELAEAQSRILALGRKTAMERVAGFLVDEQDHARTCGEQPDLLTLPLGRAEIGDLLGLTIETVSRCMTRLKKAGIIALEGGKSERVSVLDAGRLQELASAEAY